MIQDKTKHQKRTAIPLGILILCAFAVIGVGYAMSSDVVSNDNDLDGDYLVLDRFSGGVATVGAIFTSSDIIAEISTTHDSGGYTAHINGLSVTKSITLRANTDKTGPFNLSAGLADGEASKFTSLGLDAPTITLSQSTITANTDTDVDITISMGDKDISKTPAEIESIIEALASLGFAIDVVASE